jgi:hypothetical protein
MENRTNIGHIFGSSFLNLQPAEKINDALDKLPVGTEHRLFDSEGVEVEGHKLIRVNGKDIDVPSDMYVMKQHREAFRPIIEGMTLRGESDWKFAMWSNNKRANMGVFVGEATDGVKFGFRVTNSFDRTLAINFGMKAAQKQESVRIVEREHVLVWGYRQVCSNGMIAKIPLKTCKYLDAVTITKFKELLSQEGRILHLAGVDSKLKDMQFIVEAFLLLRNPLNRMIIDAQAMKLDRFKARQFLKKYVVLRRQDEILSRFNMEEQTLWGLVNAATFIASHRSDLSDSVREKRLIEASNLMTGELLEAAPSISSQVGA